MVIVYTSISSSRLEYTLSELFTRRLGLPYIVVQNTENLELLDSNLHICYDQEPKLGWIHVIPEKEIWQPGAMLAEVSFAKKDDIHFLFENKSALGFDIFAMLFWCLSRMEEYLPFEADEHNRFPLVASVAGQFGIEKTPYLDIAIQYFCSYSNIDMPNKYGIYPSIDIDIAYKYLGRSFVRNVGSLARQMIHFDTQGLLERLQSWYGKNDPWDTYDYLISSLGSHYRNARIFVLMNNGSKYDKAILPNYTPWYNRLLQLSKKMVIGIHPGYYTGQNAEKIIKEKVALESICGQTVSRSRQHFLRVNIPETYQEIVKAGIDHEYSMGFADGFGFRAGTGHSFRFYNLISEETTSLIVHPFCAMDVSAKNYMKISAEVAIQQGLGIREICEKTGSPFCFIFHNESLSEDKQWKGWRKVWEAWLA